MTRCGPAEHDGEIMRELTYKVPFDRLTKLSRSLGRKAIAGIWWKTSLLLALFVAVVIFLLTYIQTVTAFMASIGIPSGARPYGFYVALAVVSVLFMVSSRMIRRTQVGETKARVDFDQTIHLVQDDGGIRIGTEDIEFYLKWSGISQLLLEPDGVVISHGNLFWLILDTAFASPSERLDFIRDVYNRLSDRARAISEKQLRPVLGGA